ncbi:MAG: hypothetical protein DIU79_03215 [Actinobacteria bacterium]|nr:MAG: hypothetical protein DIU79_03215 [Actinomycetota bacterium]
MSVEVEQDAHPVEPARSSRARDAGDLALRVCGGVLSVIATLVTVVLELLLAPLRIGGHLVGVSVPVVVVANAALGWFAIQTVGRRWALALPFATWFVTMAVIGAGRPEGDILLADTWVGYATVFAGVAVFAVQAFRLILSR